jgi:ribosomal RNA-processing protein 1
MRHSQLLIICQISLKSSTILLTTRILPVFRANIFMFVYILRLWKGLYYCYWMSDKPLVQEELADNIASIIGELFLL